MLVVAGVPGAGKTTLIRRVVDRDAVQVVDTDDRRAEAAAHGTRLPRLLHLDHYRRIAAALASERPVVVHTRGTRRALRVLLLVMAARAHRSSHLILLHAGRREVEAGQRARGRTLGTRAMDRQYARWNVLLDRASARGRLTGERWASLRVLTRAQAAAVGAVTFEADGRKPAAPRTAGRGAPESPRGRP